VYAGLVGKYEGDDGEYDGDVGLRPTFQSLEWLHNMDLPSNQHGGLKIPRHNIATAE